MKQKGYYRAADSLKGLFILMIALHNTLAITPLFSNIPGTAFIIRFGGLLGNSMFYILSGFLLSGGYRDRIQSHGISFPEYLRRRLRRLYPMHLLSNGAMLMLEILRYGVSAVNIQKIVFCILLVNGSYNHPTAFLFALFACYILFFAISYFAKSSTHYVSCLTIGVIVGYTLMKKNPDLPFLTSGNGVAYMNFFLGCILVEVYPLILEKQRRWLQPLVLVLLPLLMYLMLAYGVEVIAGNVQVAFAFAICPMILYLALADGLFHRVLQLNCLVFLGKISSSVFFWHLVLYFAFLDLYAVFAPMQSVREPQYLLYFAVMTAFSWGMSKMAGRKPALVDNRSGV